MTDITIGQYFPKNSAVHKLDPRTKLLFTLGFMVLIFTVHKPVGIAAAGILTALIIILSGVPVRYYFKGLRPLLFIILFTALLNLFFSPGNVLFTVPHTKLTVTDRGVELSVFMVLRLVILFASASALTFTTSPVALTDGLEALLRPLEGAGVPANEIAMMMSIALRFIPTFAEEAEKIKMAQTARGADFTSGNLITRAKAMIPVLIPLFVGAFRRADDLATAMEARCYRGGNGRTRLKKLMFGKGDALSLVIFVLFAAAMILPEFLM